MIMDEPCGAVKIGIAGNVRKRLAQIQTHNPHRLEIHHEVEFPTRSMARQVESLVHETLTAEGLYGEWFACGLDAAFVALEDAVGLFAYDLGLKDPYEVRKYCGLSLCGRVAQ